MEVEVGGCGLLQLPAELIHAILSHLDVAELGNIAQTCRRLGVQSYDDQIWQPIVNAQLLDPISSPAPCKNYRELYLAHHPYWFLVRNRIWFGDAEPNGKLLVTRYNAERGCIEAHTVVAVRGEHTLSLWEKDREVIIHSFDPHIHLNLHQPVLQLHINSPQVDHAPGSERHKPVLGAKPRYDREILMDTFDEERVFSSFALTRTLPGTAIFDNTFVWPPVRFPSASRTRNDTQDRFTSAGHRPTRLGELSRDTFRIRRWVEYAGRRGAAATGPWPPHPSSSPSSLSVSFTRGGATGFLPTFASTLQAARGVSFRPPEFITTFATLPPAAHAPTPAKPWQGIWCGDYSGHGCEFLLITQPDAATARPLPEGMDWLGPWFASGGGGMTRRRGSEGSEGSFVSAVENLGSPSSSSLSSPSPPPAEGGEREGEGEGGEEEEEEEEEEAETEGAGAQGMPGHLNLGRDAEFEFPLPVPGESSQFPVPPANSKDYSDVPTGRLEAIKLTGDPNIPRGEYTFIAPDIGHGGFLRVADEDVFRGARVVRSAGHIAGRGFVQDQYTPSQLIMISQDRLAQYWEGFGHIAYYQRVDLDTLFRSS